jgi:DHA1 family bicyclomycin/chloramphenicol resistance-like MFS transporter
MYLPALPALTQGFGATMSQAQLTLTALLLAFGCSQLIWGPLSDRFGRKPILLWGLGSCVLSALACALAPSMAWLIVWRAVQGAAMGAAVMCARAIVRDLYQPLEGARVMSKGLTGLGIIACLSAPVGGALAQLLDWRAVLLTLSLCSAATLAVIVWRFEETVPRKNPRALQASTLARNWWHILRHPSFVAFSALSVCSYAGLFTFLASSSFVFIQVLGLSKTEFGVVMFLSSLSYILGTLLCRRLLQRLGVHRTVALAGGITLTAGTLMGGLALAGWHSVWTLLPPFYLFMIGHGVHQPCGQSGAVGPFPQAAGAASALNGFLMMLAAFGMGTWLGVNMDGTVLPLTSGIWFWSVCVAASAWTLVQRHDRGASTRV